MLAARAAFPDDSLEMLANRLDCSLSTVKRHLRRARREQAGHAVGGAGTDAGADAGAGADTGAGDDRPRPRTTGVPTVDDVLDAFDDVVEAG